MADKNNNADDKKLVPSQGQSPQKSGGQALGKIDLKKVPADQAKPGQLDTEVKKPEEEGGVVNGIDTGLACLVAIAKYYNIPADYRQLERAYVLREGAVDLTTLVRAARELKLKARKYDGLKEEDLDRLVYPILIRLHSGRSVVITTIRDGDIYVMDPAFSQQPVKVDRYKLLMDWTGSAILFTRRYELDKKKDKFGFKWFIPVLTKYIPQLRSVLFMSLLLQILGLASPIFVQNIIDKVLVHRAADALDILVLGMVLCTVFQNVITGLRTYLFTNITCKMDVVLSSRLYKNVTALPISYFQKWQVGDVVSRTGELETLRSFMTGNSLTIILDIVFAVVYFIVMFFYSRILSIVVLVMIPLFVLLNVIVAPIFKRMINEKFLIGSENRSFLIETITGIHTVKASSVENNFIRRYEEMLARFVKASFNVVHVANIANSIASFLFNGFNLVILWIGAYYVMEGEITVGELIAFQMIAGQLIAPIMRLINQWQHFQQIRVSMERLSDIMDEDTEPTFNPSRTTLPSLRGDIALERLVFSYSVEGGKVLDNVNIRIPAGMKVGIVGRSGSGKSTLTKLIQRLYLPDTGRILIDGVDIAQVEPAWLRRQIGVVLQDSKLFSGSVEENIRIACPNATHEEVVQAAQLAGAHEFVSQFPHGYETFVGERGSLLSGGQRQRIAIARALLSNPRILIFDEATSALDYESENIIMNNIEPISRGRTMLMIAHRLSTVRDCDAIIVIDKGRIIEAGSHDELMKRNGVYAKLHQAQMS
ncbi:MAG: type I secretion system permease/ATPase [Selenomonadaceae bacterium]|nr:type I secretion system permease/ATPase [Selenomonadaceae bacterium]MBQ3726931.1 type I secretion system permease/ATPase [Selenomonadaceae bacterium]